MAQFTVRRLDDDIKAALQRRAARNGHSMEEEVRRILRQVVKEDSPPVLRLGSRIAARFARHGLTEEVPELRGSRAKPARF